MTKQSHTQQWGVSQTCNLCTAARIFLTADPTIVMPTVAFEYWSSILEQIASNSGALRSRVFVCRVLGTPSGCCWCWMPGWSRRTRRGAPPCTGQPSGATARPAPYSCRSACHTWLISRSSAGVIVRCLSHILPRVFYNLPGHMLCKLPLRLQALSIWSDEKNLYVEANIGIACGASFGTSSYLGPLYYCQR